MDSNISNIIITGDFSINQLNPTSNRKINSLCNQFNLFQLIEEPTHYTENSSSLIDLLFVANKESVLTYGVGEPCLDNNIRYHCPIFGVFNFLKPKCTSVRRVIWKYDQGDYNTLKSYLNDINWTELKSNDIKKYIENITSVIKEGINNTIPHKLVTIKLPEPACINNFIKRKIRQRKRLYKKVKNSNSPNHWSKFKRARNEIIDLIRKSKQKYIDSLSDKLRSGSFSSRDWWKTLKGFISPFFSSSIPPLYEILIIL